MRIQIVRYIAYLIHIINPTDGLNDPEPKQANLGISTFLFLLNTYHDAKGIDRQR